MIRCDFCGDSISFQAFWAEIIESEEEVTYKKVGMKGFDRDLNCCLECESIVKEAARLNDWEKLPDGPVKNAWREAMEIIGDSSNDN